MSGSALSHLHCLHAHCLLYRIPICPIENSVMTLLCSEYKTVKYCTYGKVRGSTTIYGFTDVLAEDPTLSLSVFLGGV